MSSSSTETELGASAAAVCLLLSNIFPPTNNPSVDNDRWRKVRVFLSAMTAEPVLVQRLRPHWRGGACERAYCRRVEPRVAPSHQVR